jgi:Zn-dependent peptidase ImmA (M78 family)
LTADAEGARERARTLLRQAKLTSPPTPIDRLVRTAGALLQYIPLDDELSGMAFEKAGQAVVAVNALHHPNRQRFTIAHELGHIVMHRDHIADQVHVDKEFRVRPDAVLRRDVLAATGTDALEIEANAFASELLMPREWLERELSGGWDIDEGEKIEGLARRFKVSVSAMQFRLLDLL